MKQLNYNILQLCKRSREGSRATQADRRAILQRCASELDALGFKPKSANGLKPKHIEALVHHWRTKQLSPATIKNRLSCLRWLSEKVDKPAIVHRNNDAYGINLKRRSRPNRAKLPTHDQIKAIDDPYIAMSLRLQAVFGLRIEESTKINPVLSDGGTVLRLKDTWCKGKRARMIPIETKAQRMVLDAAKLLAQGGSLIPQDKTYIQHKKHFYYQTGKVGLNNMHGLRHHYAQQRYIQLSGGMRPPALGGKVARDMTPDERHVDLAARRRLSAELGHGRLEVTNVYLGAG